ncbi:hypothetical protein SDC9_79077 [bioreactor metagenome]|uniref:Uncharacterized protein n=1 Tax=bioreactor metagenome TaxID=1076179 RepID=A0A644Z2Z4_9ZZZZ
MGTKKLDWEFFPNRYCECSNDGADHTNTADDQRVNDPCQAAIASPKGQTKDQSRNNCGLIALKDISGHTSAIAYIIANKVSNNGCITGVIFGNVFFDFTHKVSANISRFGVNTTTNAHEEGKQSTAEAKAK